MGQLAARRRLLAIVRRALDDAALSGIVQATSPVPVRNGFAFTHPTIEGALRDLLG